MVHASEIWPPVFFPPAPWAPSPYPRRPLLAIRPKLIGGGAERDRRGTGGEPDRMGRKMGVGSRRVGEG